MKTLMATITLWAFICATTFGQGGQRSRYSGPIKAPEIKYDNAIVISPSNLQGHPDVQSIYDYLSSSSMNGQMGVLSAANRRTLIFTPGNYSDTTINGTTNYGLSLNQYVDIVGFGPETTVLEPAAVLTAGIQIADDATAASNVITNVVSNLTIRSKYCVGANRLTGGDNDYKRTMLISNCRLESVGGDTAYISTGSKDDYVHLILVGCVQYSTYDCMVNQQANSTMRAYGGEIICNVNGNHGTAPNTGNQVRCLAPTASGAEVEAYGCRIYATSDQSAGTNQSATAHAILATAGTVRVYNCSLETNAVESGSGTAVGDAIKTATSGVVYVYGGRIVETVGTDSSYDINNASGTVQVGALDCDYTNTSGTVSFADRFATKETVTAASPTLNPFGATELDTASNDITATLGSGLTVGDIKTIVLTDATSAGDGGTTVSITNHLTSDPEVATFDAVDETGVFLWSGTEWVTIYATCTF